MTTFSDMLQQFGGAPVGVSLEEMMAAGRWYFCDPTHGSDTANGENPAQAKATLKAAYDLTRDGYNDGVVFMGGATAWNPATAFTWSNNYCHLFGTSPLPGLGNRCRIVGLAATAMVVPVTFSGAGCHIKNIQISNETVTGTATGSALVTGLRNVFENVFFMSNASTTAASYNLKEGGAENVFSRCTIGQYTNARAAASYGLWFYPGAGGYMSPCRDKFINCEFLSWGANAAHVLVMVDSAITTIPWMAEFENCLFANVGTALTQAIDDNCTAAGHQILLRGRNSFANVTAVADTLTYILTQTYFHGGLMAALAES